ncbi:hypothetical protein TYRP_015905 [Tyrophagus putrescentiae]|nr:hypothetical protein TYRP_015905 [Tyrophagus putrescentiae]
MKNFLQLSVEGRWVRRNGLIYREEDATTSAPTTSTTTTTESTTIIEMTTIMKTTFATLETDTPATSTPPTPDNYNRSDSTNQSLSTMQSNGADEGNDGLNGIVVLNALHFLGGFLLAFTLIASVIFFKKCLKRRRQSYNVEKITFRYFKQMDKVGGNSSSTSISKRPIESSLFKSISEGESGPDGNGSGNANSPPSTSMPTPPPQLFQQLPLSMVTKLTETSLKKTE